jgi:hypothetical protein
MEAGLTVFVSKPFFLLTTTTAAEYPTSNASSEAESSNK